MALFTNVNAHESEILFGPKLFPGTLRPSLLECPIPLIHLLSTREAESPLGEDPVAPELI